MLRMIRRSGSEFTAGFSAQTLEPDSYQLGALPFITFPLPFPSSLPTLFLLSFLAKPVLEELLTLPTQPPGRWDYMAIGSVPVTSAFFFFLTCLMYISI